MSDNKKSFFDHAAQTTDSPLAIEVDRAKGIYIYDINGTEYLDMISGISVNNIGHSHPHVINAITNQLKKHMHVMVYGEFIQESQSFLVKKLSDILPDSLNNIYLTNSGTEAIEGALKLAKRFTGRTEIIAFQNSYHGSSHGSLSITGNNKKKSVFRPLLPDIKLLRFNQSEDLSEISQKTACVIIEPIQGDAGVRIPNTEFMVHLRNRCSATGALLILDEIQTGFGRTGKWFAFQHFNIVPDIITLAKAMGGGMPIGAFISSKEIMKVLSHNPKLGHLTTFGGHPVNCAAALATIEVLENELLVDNVEKKGKLLESLLNHKAIKEIRRIGLMLAVEFENEYLVQKIVAQCLKKGIITFWFLSTASSFRLSPPLIISEEEIQYAAKTINEAIEEVM